MSAGFGAATHGIITHRGTVYPWQCDHMSHMNVMWYVSRFDEATWQVFGALGLGPAALRASRRGMAALEQTLQYRRELMPGDLVTIWSGIVWVREKTLRFAHDMYCDDSGEIAATCIMTGIHLDTVARRGCALPAQVPERAARMMLPPG